MPTITATEFARLDEARRLQVERYRTAYFKREKELPPDTDAGISRQWLRVKLGALDCLIPVGMLTKWAATFGESAPISFDIIKPFVTISRGTSRIKAFVVNVLYNDKGEGFAEGFTPIAPLNPPVVLSVTPDNTLAVELPDLAEELAILRAETTSNRRQVNREKAIAKASKQLKDARGKLNEATQEAAEAQAVIDSMTLGQAITFARRCIHARRLYRAALANPQTAPEWLPLTYSREFWNVATQTGDTETRQTAPDWREYAAALDLAEKAVAAYKPRMQWPSLVKYRAERLGISLAAYKKANPEDATAIYGPAFDRLKEARRKAFDSLSYFIGDRFKEYCTAQGLPGECLASKWFDVHQQGIAAYSRARLLLKSWPALRSDLEGKVSEANAALDRANAMPER